MCVGEEVSIGKLLNGLGEKGRGVHALRRQLATAATHRLLPPATKQQVEKVYTCVYGDSISYHHTHKHT